LSIYSVVGELVYQTTVEGNTGTNVMTWNVQNSSGQPVASGIYLFTLNIPQGFSGPMPQGKVVVLH
jgi:hypothetical protein